MKQKSMAIVLQIVILGALTQTYSFAPVAASSMADNSRSEIHGIQHPYIASHATHIEAKKVSTNDVLPVMQSPVTPPRTFGDLYDEEKFSKAKQQALYTSPQTPANVPAQIVGVPQPSSSAPFVPLPINVSYEAIPYTGINPPDPHIAVGPSNVVVTTNDQWRIYDKSSPGNLSYQGSLTSWYSGVIPASTLVADPKIIYDSQNGHFILVTIGYRPASQQSWWLISTSPQYTALGTWNVYAFDATFDGTTQTTNWADRPEIGVDGNVLYVASNMFNFSPIFFRYGKIRAISLSELYNGTITAYTDVWNLPFSINPADRYGSTGSMYFVNAGSSGNLKLWRFDNPIIAPTLVSTDVVVSAFSMPPDAEQLGTATRLDTNDERVLQAQYRSGHIWAVHMVSYDWGSGPRSAVRLYEIKEDGALSSELTFGNPNYYFFYPSFATDPAGNMVLCYSISGSTLYASIGYSARSQPDTGLLKTGEASYQVGNPSRWGDFSGTAIDPVSGNFWMFNEYPKSGNVWSTWIGAVSYRKVFLPLIRR
jgi:hypothetical protein